jgi:hypothetical protein
LERGGIKTELRNNAKHGKDLDVVYMQYFPWYIRVLLHTLKITINGVPVEQGNVSVLSSSASVSFIRKL